MSKSLTPQAETVLRHLHTVGSLTGVEAAAIHKVRHLPRRIADLRAAGYPIFSVAKRDVTGQRYVSYVLLSAPSPTQTEQVAA